MSGNQTKGFDVIYEISTGRFLGVLRNLLVDDLPLRLGHVDLDVLLPGTVPGVHQPGYVSLPSRPNPSLALVSGSPNRFDLTLTFDQSVLSLQALPGGGLLGAAGLAGLAPQSAGTATLVLHLEVAVTMAGGRRVSIRRVSASSPLDLPGLAGTSFPTPAGITLPLPTGASPAQMLTAVRNAISSAVVSAVEAFLPLDVPIAFPSSGPCGIFPQGMQTRFLPADTGHQPSLAFLLTLMSGSTGRPDELTASHVGTADEGTLLIANTLLMELVCCILPTAPQISGLPPTPTRRTTTPEVCCRWENLTNLNIGGTVFPEAPFFEVCIVSGGIEVRGRLIQRGTGWWARCDFRNAVTVRRQAGSLQPVAGAAMVTVETGLEWWVWLVAALLVIIGAVVGFFVGGVPGAIAGGLIGAAVAGVLIVALYGAASLVGSTVGTALGTLGTSLQSLQLLPADLTGTFGSLDALGDPVIDDMFLRGRVRLPERRQAYTEASDMALVPGATVDLDRGVLLSLLDSSRIDPDADLQWGNTSASYLVETTIGVAGRARIGGVPSSLLAPTLRARGSARLVLLSGASFWTLTEADVASLVYPASAGSIPSSRIPLHNGSNPPNPVVFAVRTTEGRYAKCAAWQDSQGRLHLRFRTYDTPVRLRLESQWNSTMGSVVKSDASSFIPQVEHEVAWHGVLRAVPQMLVAPISYRWYWNGTEIRGSGTLPDGTTSYRVTGDRCEVDTGMAAGLAGEICVEATDATRFAVTACRRLDLATTQTEVDRAFLDQLRDRLERYRVLPDPIGPDPVDPWGPYERMILEPPLEAQLTAAVARGMKVAVEKVVLH